MVPLTGKFNKIPGPLGLDAASLKGKNALVTGSGMSDSICFS